MNFIEEGQRTYRGRW